MVALGHVFSALSLLALLITNLRFRVAKPIVIDSMRCAEYLLLAASAYFFRVYSAAVVMIVIAVDSLLQGHLLYRRGLKIERRLEITAIAIVVGIIVNNSGWLAALPIFAGICQLLPSPQIVFWMNIDNMNNAFRRGSRGNFIWLIVTIGCWIAYAAIIGDYCTLYSRIGIALKNTVAYAKAEWRSKEEIKRRRFRKTHKRGYR